MRSLTSRPSFADVFQDFLAIGEASGWGASSLTRPVRAGAHDSFRAYGLRQRPRHGRHSAALQVVVSAVEHLALVGHFIEIADERICDQVVCASTTLSGEFVEFGVRLRREVDLHVIGHRGIHRAMSSGPGQRALASARRARHSAVPSPKDCIESSDAWRLGDHGASEITEEPSRCAGRSRNSTSDAWISATRCPH